MKDIKVSTETRSNVVNIADYLKGEKSTGPEEKSFYIKIDVKAQTLEHLDYWRFLSNPKNNMRTIVALVKEDISKWQLFKMYCSLFFEQIKKPKL